MKQKSSIILVSLLILTSACSRDFDENGRQPVAPEPEPEQGYVVSVEQALVNLESELSMICDNETTRATAPRRYIRAVRSVAYDDVAPATRSEEMPDDVADLLYIVEFADGDGSAVLGADSRVEPVLAILYETVLPPEDFARADIASDDITSYMAALMVNSATGGIINFDSIKNPSKPVPIDRFWGPGRDTIFCKQAPLLKTKWHQNKPYNDLYPSYNSKRYPAGCGVIAVSQILAHNKYPELISINDFHINWNILDKFRYNDYTTTDSDKVHLATVIVNIGHMMNMKHISNNGLATQTNISGAASTMQRFGYKQVSPQVYSLNATHNMVCNKQLPVFIRGEQSGKENTGHAWIIDGWNEYTVRYWNCYYYTHGGTDMEILDKVLLSSTTYTKMHCNFGWGGLCDGYYSENIFDTTKHLNNANIDTSVGDYSGIGGYLFNSNFKIITYSL